MRRTPLAACLLALPLLAAPEPGEGHVITIKRYPDPGKSTVVKDTGKFTSRAVYANGQEFTSETTSDEEYTLTVQEKGDKHPKKFTRKYTKAVVTRMGKQTPLSHQGRTVVFQLRDGKYEARAEGEPPLDKADLKRLTDKANESLQADLDKAYFPNRPVKEGDRWAVNMKALGGLGGPGGNIDTEKSTGHAKLVKVYTKDGKRFGVIEIDMDLVIKSAPPNVKFDPPAKFPQKQRLETAIDGSTVAGTMTTTGKLTGKASVRQGDKTLTVELTVDSSGKQTQSPEK